MTIRTIIVDDEILARIGLRSFIDGQSDIVVKGIFGSGEEALEYLEQNETDVVITDIEMAGLSGLDFISMLRSRGYEGGIVITSCHDDFSYAQEAIRHGTDAYLLKINLDQDKLVSEIRRVFESRTKNAAAFRRGLKQERSIKHDLLLREEGDKMLGAYAGAETAKGGETADRK